ncbi:hypothetical protein C5167_003442 [Papaver somniferum]|uniref:Uncharacterized protein n=1 Tax=Papaver somniferum TaxID=3469 RepID=A0A4Y7L3I7_PAPSO|nr:hypothetical protein C5167_003442 [Papaver somniferum]
MEVQIFEDSGDKGWMNEEDRFSDVYKKGNKVSEVYERNKAKGKHPSTSNVISDELEEVFGKKTKWWYSWLLISYVKEAS